MMPVRLKASLNLNEGLIKRAQQMLRGAPDKVHQHRLTVGFHEAEGAIAKNDYNGKPTTSTILDVASAHEFGERSFIRTWFDTNVEQFKSESTDAMRAEYQGNVNAVEMLARRWAVELQHWLNQNEAQLKALSPATIEARRKAGLPDGPPLVATEQLVKAIRAMADGSYVS